jgi:hypothetical protein
MRRWLRALVSGRRLDRELDAELRFHIDMETQKYVGQGLAPEEARALAWRNFGPMVKHTEESRDQRGVGVVEALVQDVRYGTRVIPHLLCSRCSRSAWASAPTPRSSV